MRENLKTKGDFERDLQTEINQIVKYIDASWPCISSGKMTGKRNAGHFYSVGAYPTIRFNLFNIYNQSEYQNTYKSGNPIGYREGLINTFGIPHMTYVENLKNYPPIKLTIEQLKEAISNARTILKELKKNECVYTVEQRLEKRREFNLKIGIYND